MRIAVCGLWHLGSVTAACLAKHFHTVAYDADAVVVEKWAVGEPPLFEPGLKELMVEGMTAGRLTATTDPLLAVKDADVVWITWDTPVDDNDVADSEFVVQQTLRLLPALNPGALVLISSQVPVGTTTRLAQAFPALRFAYSPENLRLGKAISVFLEPDRIVVGVREGSDQDTLRTLLAPFGGDRIEWMSVESAEMTKHALNAFLATSVTFINDIAGVCEAVGADAKEVERGLKTEARIGPRAYLGPGSAFAGGTLARDIQFLVQLAEQAGLPGHMFRAVKASNDAHRGWARRHLLQRLGDLRGRRVALLGLTYKAGTDTLRRSSAVELGEWLLSQDARVTAYDPALAAPVAALPSGIKLCASVADAIAEADAIVIATEWPEFRSLQLPRDVLVLDPNRFLSNSQDLRIVTVGKVTSN